VRAGDVVSLRISTADGPSEVVGTLVAASAEALSVRRRDGTVVEVAVDAVVTGRVVPPAPSARVDVAELHRVMASGWRALEAEPLGEWLLRAGGGFTRRANSALVLGSPGVPLDAAVTRVEKWYGDRGLPPRLQIPASQGSGLADVIGPRGWTAATTTSVMTAEAAAVLRSARDVGGTIPVRVDPEPDDGWLAAYRSDAHPLPAVARAVLVNHDRVGFASVRSAAGQCLAVARVAVDGRWAGLFAVEVDPAHRRQGLARAVTTTAVRWAVERGARRCYLQVTADNGDAIGLWTRLGFVHHHDYVYWTPAS
jgi:N-acetylglutamate synthase